MCFEHLSIGFRFVIICFHKLNFSETSREYIYQSRKFYTYKQCGKVQAIMKRNKTIRKIWKKRDNGTETGSKGKGFLKGGGKILRDIDASPRHVTFV